MTVSIITHGQTEFGHYMATAYLPTCTPTPNNASRLRNIRNLQEIKKYKKFDVAHKPLYTLSHTYFHILLV